MAASSPLGPFPRMTKTEGAPTLSFQRARASGGARHRSSLSVGFSPPGGFVGRNFTSLLCEPFDEVPFRKPSMRRPNTGQCKKHSRALFQQLRRHMVNAMNRFPRHG